VSGLPGAGREWLSRFFPALRWWPHLNRTTMRCDAIAGLSVALVAIPQSLAYAQLAGLPPYYGLYAALIPTVVGALFGSSAQLSTGPVALTSLLTAASIAPLATAGGEQYLAYAVLLALLSGLFQIGFGMMRLGVLMNLLSHSVLMGFVNAAAILIALSQVPALLGVASSSSGHALVDVWQAMLQAPHAHGYSVLFGASAIAALVAFRHLAPRMPGVLITVTLLTTASYLLDYAGSGGRIVGEIPHGLPSFALPGLARDGWIDLIPAAFVIAVISFMEAMSSAKIAAAKTAAKWDENQELIGQGLAKVAAAFCQTMPVSGSFSRSALNLAAGARTGLSSIVCALCVLLTLLFFTPLLRYLPLPVLAAIIVMALVSLINLRSLRNAWLASRDDALAAILTFVATIAFAPEIQVGIFTGILVSLALFVYGRMRPTLQVVEPRSAEVGGETPGAVPGNLRDKIGLIRFDASLVFVNASYFEDAVLRLERRHPRLPFVLVSASSINDLDATGVEMLASLSESLRKNGTLLAFSGVKPQVRRVLDRTGLARRIGLENFFPDDDAAYAGIAALMDAGKTSPGFPAG
jgi:SulP family sulfate permease